MLYYVFSDVDIYFPNAASDILQFYSAVLDACPQVGCVCLCVCQRAQREREKREKRASVCECVCWAGGW